MKASKRYSRSRHAIHTLERTPLRLLQLFLWRPLGGHGCTSNTQHEHIPLAMPLGLADTLQITVKWQETSLFNCWWVSVWWWFTLAPEATGRGSCGRSSCHRPLPQSDVLQNISEEPGGGRRPWTLSPSASAPRPAAGAREKLTKLSYSFGSQTSRQIRVGWNMIQNVINVMLFKDTYVFALKWQGILRYFVIKIGFIMYY